MIVISGSSNKNLAHQTAQLLGAQVADVEISKFPNGEKRVWVKTPVDNQDVIVFQSFSEPVDEHIIEFCLLSDAAKHMGAKRIIALIPWLGYSPQDKEFRKGEPISVHVIARIIESVGITSVITLDIHSEHSLDFFSVPVYEARALPLFVDTLKLTPLDNHTIVAVDKGAVREAEELAHQLQLPLARFDKTRDRSTGAVTLQYLSGDVANRHVIAIDDFVSTGSTRIAASAILKSFGALTYTDCITHALLAGSSHQALQDSAIDRVITTDSYAIPDDKKFNKLEIVSAAPVLVTTIKEALA